MKDVDWQPRIIDRLTSLYEDKLSYRYIAELMTKEFQQTFTRSGISGKIHRLKLEKREPKPLIRKVRIRNTSSRPLPPPTLHLVWCEKPTFLELEYGYCKWPSGSSVPYTFCGVPAAPGEAYCNLHKGLAYYKPKKTWT